MSYFTLSNGETIGNIVEFHDEFEAKKTIPNDTQLLCSVVSAEWKEEATYDGRYVPRYLVVLLSVKEKGEWQGYEVKHNLYVNAIDKKKFDKARNNLAVYDTVSGQKLRALGAKIDDNNSINRVMTKLDVVATIGVMTQEYKNKKGEDVTRDINFVSSVARNPGISDQQIVEKAEHIKEDKATEEDMFDGDPPF